MAGDFLPASLATNAVSWYDISNIDFQEEDYSEML